MLIFFDKIQKKTKVYIHIPKNGGKHIRWKIENNNDNTIIRSFWYLDSNFDLAHIPYIKKDDYVKTSIDHYFSYSRNPYDRIISAYFYLNPNSNINNFKHFCKKILINYSFDLSFNANYIHYYPQYLFLCDEKLQINNVEVKKLEDVENPKRYKLSEYFDNECIQIINKIYESDFTLFNYEIIAKS